MSYNSYKALYIHIPFCVKRCRYCDFTTQAVPCDDPRINEYIEKLILDIRRASNAGKLAELETAYIGGGTPTHVGSALLSSLLYALSVSIDLSRDNFEFTIEANPESLTKHLVYDMWALGVNRLSIGVQSFNNELLRLLGRAHDADKAREAVKQAQERFQNISIDLMCGIPGQTDRLFAESVKEAISLDVTHVSIYPLTIEPHTPFYQLQLSGKMCEPDEDQQANQMELASEILEDAGFKRYEVASYARAGFKCRHNIAYWTGIPYIGIGKSATSMTQNKNRRMRVTDNEVTDDLTRSQMEAEDLMLGMRLADGVSDERIDQARSFLPGLEETLDELVSDGYLEHIENNWRPTRQGWLCGNDLFSRLFDLA